MLEDQKSCNATEEEADETNHVGEGEVVSKGVCDDYLVGKIISDTVEDLFGTI